MTDIQKFAAAVREKREVLGMTVRGLARKVGISPSQMSNIQYGYNWPSVPVYIKLCRVLKAGKIPMIGGHE